MPDILPDTQGEHVSAMEPLRIGEGSRFRPRLTEMAFELGQRAASFRSSLPPALLDSLATLVRGMNCYYSNLIEGHNTHPVDIERALKNDYSQDPVKRNLQLEAAAHIAVQEWIDSGGLSTAGAATQPAALREVHRRFLEKLPPELRWVEDPETGRRVEVVPGAFREDLVQVGRHIPQAIPRFLERFHEAYRVMSKTETLLASAAIHHRLLWIHPFADGNGRVARLVSHAILLETLQTGGIWSIARGFARNVQQYKVHLANCDMPRRNDLDGRGSLSEEALAEFTGFFLTVCIDQVAFMESLVAPGELATRIQVWAEEEIRKGQLPPRSGALLEWILLRGQLPRGEVSRITGTGERQGSRIISELVKRDILKSHGPRDPLVLNFPARLAHRWLPGLFPPQPD